MSRVLDLLERELSALGDDHQSEDLDLVQDIVTYCLGYPELAHRPREDLIFRRLESVDESGTFQKVHAEHEELKHLGNELSVLVANISLDNQEKLKQLSRLAARFASVYRNHMRLEEEVMFPLAVKHVTQAQWSDIRHQIDAIHDPLFGRTVDQRFTQLREEILDLG